MVHRRRIRKEIPNCLPAEASNVICYCQLSDYFMRLSFMLRLCLMRYRQYNT